MPTPQTSRFFYFFYSPSAAGEPGGEMGRVFRCFLWLNLELLPGNNLA
jgi:hypothetical protein